jgi:adenine-specific DNA-methyltransferase
LPTYRGNKRIVTLADPVRRLRRQTTDAERVLWRRLRDRQQVGAKFRRQHQFGPFILDFYCAEHRLAVEADGGQHYQPEIAIKDGARTAYLAQEGVRLLRFSDADILRRTDAVVEAVFLALQEAGARPQGAS